MVALNLDFTVPVIVTTTAPGATVVPAGGQPALRWVVRRAPATGQPVGWNSTITIVAVGDVEPAGTTSWDIIDNAGGRVAMTTTGPK
jgi:hypothetical protein